MTAYRTAIGRRLAVRRPAHRPPWRGRKAHGSIVAPLAATVAATLAASAAARVGVALARAEGERRRRAQRKRARQFALLPGERPAMGLTRIGLAQIDLALEQLAASSGHDPTRAVHETRKALKRLRGLMRLLREELGEQVYARESAVLRSAGRRLARERDAVVMLATLQGLLERHPRKLGGSGGLALLHQRLEAERERARPPTPLDEEAARARAELLEELSALRGRMAAWRLPERPGIELVEPSLRRLYRQGARRHRRAARGKGDRGRALHEWRKSVKDLRYAAEMLNRKSPAGAAALLQTGGAALLRGGHGGGRGRARARAKRAALIRRIARRADDLGEMLGEEHDLALLAERLRSETTRSDGVKLGKRTRRTLLKLIAKRRRQLRRRALREGARLYRQRPRRFLARVRDAYALGAAISPRA
jgi:CHAD domain-containing protein